MGITDYLSGSTNRNKACKTKNSENKKQGRKTDRKEKNKASENRNKENVQRIFEQFGEDQRSKSVLALDKLINVCFSQLVSNQNKAYSTTTEMQAEDQFVR